MKDSPFGIVPPILLSPAAAVILAASLLLAVASPLAGSDEDCDEAYRDDLRRTIQAIDEREIVYYTPYASERPIVMSHKDFEEHVSLSMTQLYAKGREVYGVGYVPEELIRQVAQEVRGTTAGMRRLLAQQLEAVERCLAQKDGDPQAPPAARQGFDPRDYRSVRDALDGKWTLEIQFPPGLPMSTASGWLEVNYIDCDGFPDVSCVFSGMVDTGDGQGYAVLFLEGEAASEYGRDMGVYRGGTVIFEVYGAFDNDEAHEFIGTYRFEGKPSPATGRIESGSLTYATATAVYPGGSWRAWKP